MTTHQKIARICEDAISQHVFPGCTVGYVVDGEEQVAAFGRQTYDPGSDLTTPDTLYDVASVTKSIPTSTIVHMLIEQGKIALDDAVVRWIPELQNDYRERILVRHLLTYTVIFDVPGGMSNLAQDHPEDFLPHLFASPLAAAPGSKYFYTNGPAILMGLLVERVTGEQLDVLADRLIFAPAQMRHTVFGPLREKSLAAPTESRDGHDVRGTIQDPSARTMSVNGFLSGAAGLFSTAPDLLIFMEALLRGGATEDGNRILAESTVRRFSENALEVDGETAALGWELDRELFMGGAARGTFGKTGFTGCVVLANLKLGRALVVLSNRTYPTPSPDRSSINRVRRELAGIIFDSKT